MSPIYNLALDLDPEPLRFDKALLGLQLLQFDEITNGLYPDPDRNAPEPVQVADGTDAPNVGAFPRHNRAN